MIVPTYQSSSMLHRCLQSIAAQELPVDEVIVVDDGSTDGTHEIAERLGAKVIRLKQRGGPARARNLGAAEAGSDILFFVDADIVLHPATVRRAVDTLTSNPGVEAVIGCYDDSPAAPGLVSQYRNLLNHYTHSTACRESTTFWSACGLIRRDAFLQLGGFDERFDRPSIEDIEFGWRLRAAGRRVLLDSAVQVKHLKRWTLRSFLHTDLLRRAIPWTRLILSSHRVPDDLNLKWDQRASVAMAWLSMALILGHLNDPRLAVPAVFSILAHAAINMPFLRLLARRHGLWFATAAWPLHLLFHLNGGLGFLAGAAAHLVAPMELRTPELRREAPRP